MEMPANTTAATATSRHANRLLYTRGSMKPMNSGAVANMVSASPTELALMDAKNVTQWAATIQPTTPTRTTSRAVQSVHLASQKQVQRRGHPPKGHAPKHEGLCLNGNEFAKNAGEPKNDDHPVKEQQALDTRSHQRFTAKRAT